MTPERKIKLRNLAAKALDELVEAWWYEIGSWDGYLEDEDITMEELQWIWNNVHIRTSVQVKVSELIK
jgi:hypothetical protein